MQKQFVLFLLFPFVCCLHIFCICRFRLSMVWLLFSSFFSLINQVHNDKIKWNLVSAERGGGEEELINRWQFEWKDAAEKENFASYSSNKAKGKTFSLNFIFKFMVMQQSINIETRIIKNYFVCIRNSFFCWNGWNLQAQAILLCISSQNFSTCNNIYIINY